MGRLSLFSFCWSDKLMRAAPAQERKKFTWNLKLKSSPRTNYTMQTRTVHVCRKNRAWACFAVADQQRYGPFRYGECAKGWGMVRDGALDAQTMLDSVANAVVVTEGAGALVVTLLSVADMDHGDGVGGILLGAVVEEESCKGESLIEWLLGVAEGCCVMLGDIVGCMVVGKSVASVWGSNSVCSELLVLPLALLFSWNRTTLARSNRNVKARTPRPINWWNMRRILEGVELMLLFLAVAVLSRLGVDMDVVIVELSATPRSRSSWSHRDTAV